MNGYGFFSIVVLRKQIERTNRLRVICECLIQVGCLDSCPLLSREKCVCERFIQYDYTIDVLFLSKAGEWHTSEFKFDVGLALEISKVKRSL